MKLPVEESEFIPCDILDIVRRIRPHNPPAALHFVEAFKASVDSLARMPGLGRMRPDLGVSETRSWRVGKFRRYLIFYEVLPDRLRLLRVMHGSRDLQDFGFRIFDYRTSPSCFPSGVSQLQIKRRASIGETASFPSFGGGLMVEHATTCSYLFFST